MKHVVFTVMEKNGNNGRFMVSSTIEVNSYEAAKTAKEEITRTNSFCDRVTVSIFPKGMISKEELIIQLAQANPVSSAAELNQKANEIIEILKKEEE